MMIAALVLLAVPQAAIPNNTPSNTVDSPAAVTELAKSVSSSAPKLPDSPAPKVAADDDAKVMDVSADPAAAIRPATPAAGFKPVLLHEVPSRREKKIWYGLMAVSHSAAAFDAWSTRRAVKGGYGTEANPFLRGASHSNMIYAATQVSPAVMDYLGRKMMTSRNPMLRKLWWLPQTAGTGFSISAGVHNTMLVP